MEEIEKRAIALPEVVAEETADEEKFECPQPWLLALIAMAMSGMTSITVAGSLFFVLAAPEKVSPQCHDREWKALRYMCTVSTVCFWTYPVVCCMFVVLVFAKNLVDQRIYYEFLLHKVVIGYGRANPLANGVVVALLVYALAAFSALVWYHLSAPVAMVHSVYGSLAYITPIISFLAVILTQWSIQGKLITLPNFLQDYDWSVAHLKLCRCYPVEHVHIGFMALEKALQSSDEQLDTPRMVALVEYYAKQVVPPSKPNSDIEAAAAASEQAPEKKENQADTHTPEEQAKEAFEKSATLAKDALNMGAETVGGVLTATRDTEKVYWPWRLLFNPRLQDDRAQNFRNWTLGYLISVILAIVLGVYVFSCCLITCLEIEKVLVPGTITWDYTHHFSLRPDIQYGTATKSLKQLAAHAAISFIDRPARALYNRAATVSHFQLGAAA